MQSWNGKRSSEGSQGGNWDTPEFYIFNIKKQKLENQPERKLPLTRRCTGLSSRVVTLQVFQYQLPDVNSKWNSHNLRKYATFSCWLFCVLLNCFLYLLYLQLIKVSCQIRSYPYLTVLITAFLLRTIKVTYQFGFYVVCEYSFSVVQFCTHFRSLAIHLFQ